MTKSASPRLPDWDALLDYEQENRVCVNPSTFHAMNQPWGNRAYMEDNNLTSQPLQGCNMSPDWTLHQQSEQDANASLDPTLFFGCDPSLTPDDEVNTRITDLGTELQNSPKSSKALQELIADPTLASLPPQQRADLIERFSEAPNGATAQLIKGMASYYADPSAKGLDELYDALRPDGGTFAVDGQTYSIVNGDLVDADGNVLGNILTDGTYKLNGQEERQSYYDNINARVNLTEGNGDDQEALLNLYDADPSGVLNDSQVNPTFAGMTKETIRDLRREDLSMKVHEGFRSDTKQDQDYAKGRRGIAGEPTVTNARGGESWHNYGLAADMIIHDANGRPGWHDGGDYSKIWERYGELATQNGLYWGGNFDDRPHVEYHPGLTAGQASTLKDERATGGLEGAWDTLGIGAQP